MHVAAQRRRNKEKLIALHGGCCVVCGYNKCRGALSFHHLKPEEKSFGLSAENLHNRSWDDILDEWKKCVLVCLNCHMEIHSSE
jgi:hypothetical protein